MTIWRAYQHNKNKINRAGNYDEWRTQNCPPQNCPPKGISRAGNSEGNPFFCVVIVFHYGYPKWEKFASVTFNFSPPVPCSFDQFCAADGDAKVFQRVGNPPCPVGLGVHPSSKHMQFQVESAGGARLENSGMNVIFPVFLRSTATWRSLQGTALNLS